MRRRPRVLASAVVGAAVAMAACSSDSEPEPADPVVVTGEGFTDAGPRYPGVFETDGGRTDLEDDACHAWVEVLPAGVAADDTQRYLVTFGLREPDQEPEEGTPPSELEQDGCVTERTDILDRLADRLAVPTGNLEPALLDRDGARWFVGG